MAGHVLKAVKRLASHFSVSSHSLLFFVSKHSVGCLLNEEVWKQLLSKPSCSACPFSSVKCLWKCRRPHYRMEWTCLGVWVKCVNLEQILTLEMQDMVWPLQSILFDCTVAFPCLWAVRCGNWVTGLHQQRVEIWACRSDGRSRSVVGLVKA